MDFWTQESNGTRKFFEMAVPIVSALDNGHTLYLDEVPRALLICCEGKTEEQRVIYASTMGKP